MQLYGGDEIMVWVLIIIAIVGLFFFLKWQNDSIVINKISFKNSRVPNEFNGYKIVHISDLHNKQFGEKQHNIIEKISGINPDIIVITGDMIDSYNTKVDVALELASEAIKIAPIYYVTGNHEIRIGYEDFRAKLIEKGVVVLDNEKVELLRGKSRIEIIGLADTSFRRVKEIECQQVEYVETNLNNIVKENDNFKILLSHRPHLFHSYSKYDVDLTFCGHGHGGQFRIPFVGGILVPDQGLFPKYSEGMHTENNTSMVVSRGLGNSAFPQRLFNRPELIVVELQRN